MTAPKQACPETVWRGSGIWDSKRVPCGKPVKRSGLCGVHANAADRREARTAQRVLERQQRADAESIAARLTAKLGVTFTPRLDSVTLTLAAARELLGDTE